uniref:Protein kinase domain-containing protein n=1 Tax=Chlamydomonas leiostraca TaxID=1034604 RepID=A0A7S0RAV9_9CHLO
MSAHLDAGATHVSQYSRGTPYYVAPEVLNNAQVTRASDIYSLGVLMWEVYNNEAPWRRDKDGQYHPNPRFPAQWRCEAPAVFKTLVQRCLQQDSTTRPTADELAAALDALAVTAASLAKAHEQGPAAP